MLQDDSVGATASLEQTNNTGLVLLLQQQLQAVVSFQKEFAKELSDESLHPDARSIPGECLHAANSQGLHVAMCYIASRAPCMN